ncbi:MAG: hypothetical protein CMO55_01375 [Verrucomicrobiales bacterium]|nr:hypothetical protein [Verrucomicrobiales bacterium]
MRSTFTAAVFAFIALVSLSSVLHADTFEAKFLFRFGGSGSGDGLFVLPGGAAIDSVRGRIYVTDFHGHDLQIFDLNGNFIAKIGSMGSGDGQFISPSTIVVRQSTGTVYVTDGGNNRVQYFTPSGNSVVFAGKWGSSGTGDGQFQNPSGIDIDEETGNVYVGEFGGDRVQYFSSTGSFIGKWGGLSDVTDVAVSETAGLVYVTEYNDSRYSIFELDGTAVDVVNEITPMRDFNQPAGVAVTQGGRVVVTDRTAPVPIFEGDGTLSPFEFSSFGDGDGELFLPYGIDIDEASGLTVITEGNDFVSVWSVRWFNQAPIVKVKGKKRITTKRGRIRLKGIAFDADSVLTKVEAKVGRKRYRPVKGLSPWKYRARLKPGMNRIKVRAFDDEGGLSRGTKVKVKRE